MFPFWQGTTICNMRAVSCLWEGHSRIRKEGREGGRKVQKLVHWKVKVREGDPSAKSYLFKVTRVQKVGKISASRQSILKGKQLV